MTSKKFSQIAKEVIVVPNVLTLEECSALQCEAIANQVDGAAFNADADQYEPDERVIRCKSSYHRRSGANEWLYQRLAALFTFAGEQFGIQASEPLEDMKIMIYGAGDHLNGWHQDIGIGDYSSLRRVGVSVELSDPLSYTGGELQFYPGFSSKSAVAQGGATVFTAYKYHRVTPVISGARYSLVNFCGAVDELGLVSAGGCQ